MTTNATDTKTLVANICAKATAVDDHTRRSLRSCFVRNKTVVSDYVVADKTRCLAKYISEQLARAAKRKGFDRRIISFGVTELGNMIILIDEWAAIQTYDKVAKRFGDPAFTACVLDNAAASQVVCDTLKEELGGREIRIVGCGDIARRTCIMVVLTTDENPVYDEQHYCLDADWVADARCNFDLGRE